MKQPLKWLGKEELERMLLSTALDSALMYAAADARSLVHIGIDSTVKKDIVRLPTR